MFYPSSHSGNGIQRIFAIDGSTLALPDTPKIVAKYGRGKNQWGQTRLKCDCLKNKHFMVNLFSIESDPIGPVGLANATGTVTDEYVYNPYGKVTNKTGNTENAFTYTGRYGVMEQSNGTYYMRARFYDTELKRFLNKDILIGELTDTLSLNRHAYVQGNPVDYIDPLGLAELPMFIPNFIIVENARTLATSFRRDVSKLSDKQVIDFLKYIPQHEADKSVELYGQLPSENTQITPEIQDLIDNNVKELREIFDKNFKELFGYDCPKK